MNSTPVCPKAAGTAIQLPMNPITGTAGRSERRLPVLLNQCWWAIHWNYRASHYARRMRRLLSLAAVAGIEVSGLTARHMDLLDSRGAA